MNHYTHNPHEKLLKPSEALALELSRRAGGVNRFEANAYDGHCSFGQRISDLTEKGYVFVKQRETLTDNTGKKHKGVVRYFYLGWCTSTTDEVEGAA